MVRALILTLTLVVSPLGAAVCEVVCGMAPHAVHQVEQVQAAIVDEHAHHGHHSTPAPQTAIVAAASTDGVTISVPAPECDLRAATPARLRATSTDVIASSVAMTTAVYRLDDAPARHVSNGNATTSPPAPPPLTPLPLRI